MGKIYSILESDKTFEVFGTSKTNHRIIRSSIRHNHPNGAGYDWCLKFFNNYEVFGDDKFYIESAKVEDDHIIFDVTRVGKVIFTVQEDDEFELLIKAFGQSKRSLLS